MKENNNKWSAWITIRLNEEEEKKLEKFYRRTTANSLSEYARSVLLKEAVEILFRNHSTDEFLTEMDGLRKELNVLLEIILTRLYIGVTRLIMLEEIKFVSFKSMRNGCKNNCTDECKEATELHQMKVKEGMADCIYSHNCCFKNSNLNMYKRS